MRGIEIRLADLLDADTVALFETHTTFAAGQSPACADHSFSVASLRESGVTVWCAWREGQLVGGGALLELDPLHGEVKALHTRATARGAGVADALLRHIVDESRQRGYRRLSLETGPQPGFAAARRLYARHQFIECAPFADYRADPESTFMTRGLTA